MPAHEPWVQLSKSSWVPATPDSSSLSSLAAEIFGKTLIRGFSPPHSSLLGVTAQLTLTAIAVEEKLAARTRTGTTRRSSKARLGFLLRKNVTEFARHLRGVYMAGDAVSRKRQSRGLVSSI